jgi:uracil phosphoribosyltransferase
MNVTVIDHPLVQHKLTLIRRKETGTGQFRVLVREISMLLAYEVTRDMPLTKIRIETPLASMEAPFLEGKKVALVSILRAGNAILEGMLELIPSAKVGHIGLYRDPKSLQAVEYYLKLPDDLPNRDVLLVDPMLATGNSAVAALNRLKDAEARSIKFICLLAAPEGIANVQKKHPDIPIFTASIDERLNEHGYILPGLGDAGDRVFGTK